MKPDYIDIREKLGEPRWYDEHGVPRYCEFSPDKCGIYIDYVALVRIACQDCGKEFLVASELNVMDVQMLKYRKDDWEPALPNPEECSIGSFHYGDPPSHTSGHWNRCVGDTMNSIPLEVIEFWDRRANHSEWQRRPECEGVIEDYDWRG